MDEKETYHFISHTHWDREWYLTFEQFRYRLVQLIDHLLDLLEEDLNFQYFHLDGQTIVLEDYLEMRPYQRDRLQRFIREGRILIGPWYEQNDLFLTSAESTVRNLMEGIRLSREWTGTAGEMKVGYLPDHFGLIGQMPQILRGVGIDNAIFGRGYDIGVHGSPHIRWCSPDGSQITGILLTNWYNNAQRLPDDREELRHLFPILQEREKQVLAFPHYLMMNGVDHLEAQENLTSVLQKLRTMFGEKYDFVHDTLPRYVKKVQGLLAEQPLNSYPFINGELREREDSAILGGTLSSRVYLKQANMETHNLIEKWLEPLSTWCAAAGLDEYDQSAARYLWKLYMKNHPHDSICGCSQDAVHDHMMDRYASIQEVSEDIIDRKLEGIANQIDKSQFENSDLKLLAVNAAQIGNHSVVKSSVYFLAEDDVQDFQLLDEHGESVPYRMTASEPSRIRVLSPINLPGVLQVKRFDFEWRPAVPALGYVTYRVRPSCEGKEIKDVFMDSPQSSVLENEHLKVEVQPNGTFDLTEKHTGQVYRGIGQFEDTGDRGNLYVFSSIPNDQRQIYDRNVQFLHCRSNDLYDECQYRLSWLLPVGLNADYDARQETEVACEFDITLRLDKGSSQLSVQIAIENQAKDHRLRWMIPFPKKMKHVHAGGQFDVVHRTWEEGRIFQRDCNAQPFWKWLAPSDGKQGLAVFAKGLHEYEALGDDQTLAITLLRCVETINVRQRSKLESDIQPKGQCLGHHQFELAIRPFDGVLDTQLYEEAERFQLNVRTKQAPIDDARWTQGRAWVQATNLTTTFAREEENLDKERLPLSGSFFQMKGKVMISSIKWAEDNSGIVLRLYNVETSHSSVQIQFHEKLESVVEVNLLEEALLEHSFDGTTVQLNLQPKRIGTYKFTFLRG